MTETESPALPANVIFGAGTIQRLPGLLEQHRLARPLILMTPGRTIALATLARILAQDPPVFDRAAVHVPAAVVKDALEMANRVNADCTISLGGGSATGLGKMLRLNGGLPQIAIPTTYAGSEMTPIWGTTESNVKRTGRDPSVLPVAVICDPELLVSLPLSIAGPSALNAMAQAIANVLLEGPDPAAHPFAVAAIRRITPALPALSADAVRVETCSELLHGAVLAGAALGAGTTGLHHRVCHVLGGMFNLPHADTHAIVLPYSTSLGLRALPAAGGLLAEYMNTDDPAGKLHQFMRRVCTRPSLREMGLDEADLGAALDALRAGPGAGMSTVDQGSVRRMLQEAFAGDPPAGPV